MEHEKTSNYCDMTCPICEEKNITHKQVNNTHIYICENCPMVSFELVDEEDRKNMINYLGGDKKERPLWLLQQDYQEELERRREIVANNELTIRELLTLGFNNNYLKTSFYGEIELGYVDKNGNIETDLTQEQLDIKVKKDENPLNYNEDDEGYSIISVICVNNEDEEKLLKNHTIE